MLTAQTPNCSTLCIFFIKREWATFPLVLIRSLFIWVCHVEWCQTWYTAISRKGEKSARDNPERYCGWFWAHYSSKKFEIVAREAMDICVRILNFSHKSRFVSYSTSGTVYWSYAILSFGIVACTFCPTTSFEIAVFILILTSLQQPKICFTKSFPSTKISRPVYTFKISFDACNWTVRYVLRCLY